MNPTSIFFLLLKNIEYFVNDHHYYLNMDPMFSKRKKKENSISCNINGVEFQE